MVPANAPRRLLLASHVRACECDGLVILLDLRRNRYLGISAAASQALAGRLENWPGGVERPSSSLSCSATADLLHKFISQGLVIDTANAAKTDIVRYDAVSIVPNANLPGGLHEATSTIELDQDLLDTPWMSTRKLQPVRFARSVATAAFWIRTRSMESIASEVQRRGASLRSPRVEAIESMKRAIVAYEYLRPFVFTAREQCLLDSLALVQFLAHDGVVPRWVVGVRTGPFAAHSWVQTGHTVLNDQHEYVRQFRPILVV